jgi:hypothetical protein
MAAVIEDMYHHCWWQGNVRAVHTSADGNQVDIWLDSFRPDMHVAGDDLCPTPRLPTDMTLAIIPAMDRPRVQLPTEDIRILDESEAEVNTNSGRRTDRIGTTADFLAVRVQRARDAPRIAAYAPDSELPMEDQDAAWAVVRDIVPGVVFIMQPFEGPPAVPPMSMTAAQWKHELLLLHNRSRTRPAPDERWAWCENLLRFTDPLEALVNGEEGAGNAADGGGMADGEGGDGDGDNDGGEGAGGRTGTKVLSAATIESVFNSLESQYEDWTLWLNAMYNRGLQLELLKTPRLSGDDDNPLAPRALHRVGGARGAPGGRAGGARRPEVSQEDMDRERNQVLMFQYYQHVAQVAVDAYEFLHATYKFTLNFQRPMTEQLFQKRPWFDRMKDYEADDNDSSVMVKYLLMRAAEKKLKKNKDIVYEPKTVHNFLKWEPHPQLNGQCCHRQCTKLATFGERPKGRAVVPPSAGGVARVDGSSAASPGAAAGARVFPPAAEGGRDGAMDDGDDDPAEDEDGEGGATTSARFATQEQSWESAHTDERHVRHAAGSDADFEELVTARRWCIHHARIEQEKLTKRGSSVRLEDLRYAPASTTPMFGTVRTFTDAETGERKRVGEWVTVHDVDTGSWVPMMHSSDPFELDAKPLTVYEWASRVVNRTQTPALEHKAMQYLRLKAMAVEYITASSEADFPNWRPDRFQYSFRNGVYIVGTGMFHEYLSDMWEMPKASSVNFINEFFHPNWSVQPPETIEVEWYDMLTKTQFPDDPREPTKGSEMRKWHDIGLGRLFAPVGVYDRWERLMAVTGCAGTGKSTIASALRLCAGSTNVGLIPSNAEVQWALAPVRGKSMWMCPEMKKNFKLDLATMQSMVSGEATQVSQKNKDQVDLPQWTTPGIVFGNELPEAWMSDVMNALVRRLWLFNYKIRPPRVNLMVGSDMRHHLAPFLARITRQYFNKVLELRETGQPLDEVVPKTLLDTTEEFKRQTNPVLAFLESPNTGLEVKFQYHCLEKLTSGADAPLKEVDLMRLGLTHADIARGKAEERARYPEDSDCFDIKDYCVLHDQVQKLFNAYYVEKRENNRVRPSFNQAETYDPACWEKKIAVVGPFGHKMWYGVRLVMDNGDESIQSWLANMASGGSGGGMGGSSSLGGGGGRSAAVAGMGADIMSGAGLPMSARV